MRSFDVAYRFQLLLTLSNIPPVRAHAVIVVVVIVVVDITRGRNAKKKLSTHNLLNYLLSTVLHLIDIYLTSLTILDQYSAEPLLNNSKFIDSSM